MPTLTKDNSINPFAVDEGMYRATVLSVETKKGPHGDFLVWNFQLKDPIQDGEVVENPIKCSGATPSLLQDDSKLDKWLKACGISTEDGDDVDTDDAIGKRVRILVESYMKGDKEYHRVTKVYRLKKKAKKEDEEEEENDEEAKPKKKAEAKKTIKDKTPKKTAEKPKKEEPKDEDEVDSSEDDSNLWDELDDDDDD